MRLIFFGLGLTAVLFGISVLWVFLTFDPAWTVAPTAFARTAMNNLIFLRILPLSALVGLGLTILLRSNKPL